MMAELIDVLYNWLMSLGDEYGVDPLIFGVIYVGAIPFFTASIGWLIFNIKRDRSPFFPILAASVCALSAYIYLFIAGEHLPPWVYMAVAVLLAYSGFGTYQKVQKKTDTSSTDIHS